MTPREDGFEPGIDASPWDDEPSRRRFLKLMGASIALAGMSGCTRQPLEKIVPYVRAPEDLVPGKPLFFASSRVLGGTALGVLVESHMGRPTKIEGNPEHPSSLGSTDALAQASILDLYDPDRSQVVTQAGQIATWPALLGALSAALAEENASRGAGIRILTETITSPSLAARIRALLAKYPEARWHSWEPFARESAAAGARMAHGEPLNTVYRLDRADVILALDSDFLHAGAGSVRYARDFASRRRPGAEGRGMNRLYSIESAYTLTGAAADHRLAVRASEMDACALRLASELDVAAVRGRAGPSLGPERDRWMRALAGDLRRAGANGLVVAGDDAPAAVHALAHAINGALGAAGGTMYLTDPLEAGAADRAGSLGALLEDVDAGKVRLLVILGGNPVYSAPERLDFASRIAKVKVRVHLSLHADETSRLCHWHIPEAHWLESWGDARAHDGTISMIQPLIAPLYNGRSAHEVISAMLGEPARTTHDVVRAHWTGGAPAAKDGKPSAGAEEAWLRSVHDGFVAGSALPPREARLREALEIPVPQEPRDSGAIEVVFRPDPSTWDGRFANNAWLQELPRPFTKITWDGAALMAPATAAALGLEAGDVARIAHEGRSIEAPVWILPGQAQGSITVHRGQGRTLAGRVGNGVGFRVSPILPAGPGSHITGVEVTRTGARHEFAATQLHHDIAGGHARERGIVREGTLDDFRKSPESIADRGHAPPADLTLYPAWKNEGHAWGMSIDLGSCTGCNACMVACQAENNIPVVGKEEVARGREMHWIRVDTYFTGAPEADSVAHQPVPCMHCETAPCEVVCPVNATVHGPEGLNEMVYNRCVGTRYCSNNCPYKVRRFNFFRYADLETPSLRLLHNPDVTVRTRGVMEKCTYCVQRISAARIQAKKDGRRIRDGEVTTACEAACPSRAIVFGDLNDPASRVSRMKASPLDYGLLEELNTRPRTTYLARVRNPNPEIRGA